MNWGNAIFYALGLLLIVRGVRQTLAHHWVELAQVFTQAAFFFVLWLIKEYLREIIQYALDAFAVLDQHDQARLVMLEDIRLTQQQQQIVADELAVKVRLAEEASIRHAEKVASTAAETATAVKTNLDDIKDQLRSAIEVSTTAADAVKDVHKQITDATGVHAELVTRLEQFFNTARPDEKRD